MLIEKTTRSEMIEKLKEIGWVTVDSKQLEGIMPMVYDYLKDEFEGFVADPNNEATKEELEDFQEGNYLVDIYFSDRVTYTVGVDAQQLANDPDWAEDSWDDIQTEELQALLKVAKQG
jgi:hypothetical protein